METIPCEILIKILNNLDLNEILKSRCVNKKWRSSIDNNIRFKNLLITNECLTKYDRSSLTHQSIDCSYWIKRFNSLNKKLKFSIFSNLKNLYLNTLTLSSNLNFGKLVSTNFKQLEILEIIQLKINTEICMINLPKLIELNLENIRFKAITLETPNLNKLRVQYNYNNLIDLDRIKFKHPLSLTKLEIKSFQPKIESFLNLEYLYCKEIEFIDSKFLKQMANLKELHFNQSINQREDVFSSLKQQILKLKKNNLKIYNFGLNLSNLPSFRLDDGYSLVDSKTTQFFCDHYDKLATELPFIYGIDYSTLANCFLELPTDFKSKFVNINSVLCKSEIDAKQFINFLKNYRNLKSLNLNSTSLKQSFFNLLPYLCPNLTSLTINEVDLDLNFILKFKNLYVVDTFQEVGFNILYKIFKKTKIEQLFFGYQNDYMSISHEKGIFKFSLASEEPDEFRSIRKIINLLKNSYFVHPYIEYEEESNSQSSVDIFNEFVANRRVLNEQSLNRQVLKEQVPNRRVLNELVLNDQLVKNSTPNKINKLDKENTGVNNVQVNDNQDEIELIKNKKEKDEIESKNNELDENLCLFDFDENDVNQINDADDESDNGSIESDYD